MAEPPAVVRPPPGPAVEQRPLEPPSPGAGQEGAQQLQATQLQPDRLQGSRWEVGQYQEEEERGLGEERGLSKARAAAKSKLKVGLSCGADLI